MGKILWNWLEKKIRNSPAQFGKKAHLTDFISTWKVSNRSWSQDRTNFLLHLLRGKKNVCISFKMYFLQPHQILSKHELAQTLPFRLNDSGNNSRSWSNFKSFQLQALNIRFYGFLTNFQARNFVEISSHFGHRDWNAKIKLIFYFDELLFLQRSSFSSLEKCFSPRWQAGKSTLFPRQQAAARKLQLWPDYLER